MADLIATRELDDMVLLDDISEEAVARTLGSRLKDGKMYTSIGPVLVSCNPYKLLNEARSGRPLYDDLVADMYRGRTRLEMPPHAFSVAESAYSSLLSTGRAQSVIVSGESGAGKTEACRVILGYIARVSGAYAAGNLGKKKYRPGAVATAADKAAEVALRVRDRLVTSGLVLEAFGNAQTLRNDNSSRFGKLQEVMFSAGGVAKGGTIRIYLLEKNRVTWQREGERGFHVLYQLAAGAPPDLKSVLKLKGGPESFAFLNSEHRKIPGVNDAGNFTALTQCLRVLGVDPAEQTQWWKVLAAVLHLGNIDFTSTSDQARRREKRKEQAEEDGEEAVDEEADVQGEAGGSQLNEHAARPAEDSATTDALKSICALLAVEEKVVVAALTTRTLKIRGETTHSLNSAKQSRFTRDSLAKAMYSRLFQAVVDRINAAVAVGAKDKEQAAGPSAHTPGKSTGKKEAGKTVSKTGPPAGSPIPAKVLTPAGDSPGRDKESKGHGSTPDPVEAEQTALPAADAAVAAAEEIAFEAEATAAASTRLALLDLYGFEVFDRNGFEQLCINYANEKLQALFIQATLQEEQEEYARENIAWEPVPFFDNSVVIGLLSGKAPSIFALLDDACHVADSGEGATGAGKGFMKKKAGPDTTFLHALVNKLGDGKTPERERFTKSKVEDGSFVILHYAGPCKYNVDGMVAANKDSLNNDAVGLMLHASGIPLLATMFADNRTSEEKAKRTATASSAFRSSVEALVSTLASTAGHYVRCVKPNSKKAAVSVEEEMLQEQVKYLGLLENVKVRRAGWAYREEYGSFLARYRILSSTTWPPKDGDAESQVRALVAALNLHDKPKGMAIGVGMGPPVPPAPAAGGPGRGGAKVAIRGRGGMPMGRGGAALPFLSRTGGSGRPGAVPTGPDPLASISSSMLLGDVSGGASYKLVDGKEVQFGASKLFIRESKHLFSLEYCRSRALGTFQARVAAVWRAYDGKRQYRKIVAAWHRVIASAQTRLARKRYLKMKKTCITIQAHVRGWIIRRSPAVEDLREGLGLVSFHGKTRRRLSLRWAKPAVQSDWLGLLIPSSGTPSPVCEAVVKALARLSPPQEVSKSTMHYSDHVLKIRQTYKVVRRAVVVTNDFVVSFSDPWQKGVLKRAFRIVDIERISMSPHRDRYLTLHVGGPRGYAFTCIAQTAVPLTKAIVARHKALTGLPSGLPVEVAECWSYKAYAHDKPEQAREIRVAFVQDKAAFTDHALHLEQWEKELLIPSVPGGVGGQFAETVLAGAEAAGFPEEAIGQPFHARAVGSQRTLVVSVPVPKKPGLKELLTDKEKEALKKLGLRPVMKL